MYFMHIIVIKNLKLVFFNVYSECITPVLSFVYSVKRRRVYHHFGVPMNKNSQYKWWAQKLFVLYQTNTFNVFLYLQNLYMPELTKINWVKQTGVWDWNCVTDFLCIISGNISCFFILAWSLISVLLLFFLAYDKNFM